jgi:hydroxymethylpyrimidine pyrophosphatase-like HAD family hydrolase
MINKVKAILKNATRAGSKVIIVTARPNFDNKKLFLDTFRQQGIDIDKIYVERAGNLGGGPAADNKKVIFRKYLDKKIYKRIRLFDDAKSNLKAFLSLQKDYPEVSFEAYHAKSNGSVNRVR